jgi:hypothetical protein
MRAIFNWRLVLVACGILGGCGPGHSWILVPTGDLRERLPYMQAGDYEISGTLRITEQGYVLGDDQGDLLQVNFEDGAFEVCISVALETGFASVAGRFEPPHQITNVHYVEVDGHMAEDACASEPIKSQIRRQYARIREIQARAQE